MRRLLVSVGCCAALTVTGCATEADPSGQGEALTATPTALTAVQKREALRQELREAGVSPRLTRQVANRASRAGLGDDPEYVVLEMVNMCRIVESGMMTWPQLVDASRVRGAEPAAVSDVFGFVADNLCVVLPPDPGRQLPRAPKPTPRPWLAPGPDPETEVEAGGAVSQPDGVSPRVADRVKGLADAGGYGPVDDDFVTLMGFHCQDVAAGHVTWEELVASDVADGARRADAQRLYGYVAERLCPQVAP